MDGALPRPSKIVCIGRNYAAHAHELNSEIPEWPVVFLKPPSSLVGNGGSIVIPAAHTSDVHHEVELVVEIGEDCKDVAERDALSKVSRYAVGLDMTARDIQSAAKKKGLPWTVSKGFDTFSPIGELTPADGVDPSSLEIRLTVNGEVRQHSNTSLMLFPVPHLISYCSSIFTLTAGDLIYTGTPEGVAAVTEGDVLTATINGFPELTVNVVQV